MFGSTAGTSTSTFGSTSMFGQQPLTSTSSFGGNNAFGGAKPAFGGFGATATTSAPPPAFGSTFGSTAPSFGAPTATSSSFGFGSSSFGSFGSTANTAPPPAFGSTFGASTSTAPPAFGSTFGTSSAPSFGGFNSAPSFGSSFGAPQTSMAPAYGFGGNPANNMQQQPVNPTEQLLNAIMRVSLFGDDRDNLVAKWNLLQASWGVGKAFYATTQPPVQMSTDNPLCRFKAVGYSALPTSKSDLEKLSLIIKKKPAEVEPLKQQIINDLQAALGNKPTIKVVIEDAIEPFGSESSRLNFHVLESAMNNTRKINADDIYNALNQGNTWAALQQRHNFESLAPHVAFVKEQLDEYLKNPPVGVDPRLWKQAQLDNPASDQLLPVPLVGFKSLQSRIKRQEHQAKIYQGRLDNIANDIAESQKKQQDNTAKLRDARRKQLELSHRVLNIITRQEMTRKLGFTIQLEEEKLRMQLEALQAQISAPTQFKGRLNELLSQVRLQSQANGPSGADQGALDQFAREDIKNLLKHQHEGIQSLVSAMKQDLEALETMNEKLSSGKTSANK